MKTNNTNDKTAMPESDFWKWAEDFKHDFRSYYYSPEAVEHLDLAKKYMKLPKDARNNAINRFQNKNKAAIKAGKFPPLPWQPDGIAAWTDDIKPTESRERIFASRFVLCYFFEEIARLNDAPRIPYWEFSLKRKDTPVGGGSPYRALFEMAYPAKGDETWQPPSLNVIKRWYDEFDLPDMRTIIIPSEEDLIADKNTSYTLEELVVLARVHNLPSMPKSMRRMAEKAKRENWKARGGRRRE